MAAFLELHLKGGGCGIIECGSICGVIARGHDAWAPGTPEAPTLVIIRGGETLEVIGESPAVIIGRMVMTKKRLRADGLDVLVDWLRPLGEGAADERDRPE